jgi:hypothetical protein
MGNLPAVAAVTTVAAITAAPATTTASATIATTATAAAAPAIASAPTAATRPLGLRTRFIDYQVPATEILTVEIGDRAIRFFIIRNFDEGKTPRLAREPIPNQIDCGRVYAYLSEPLLQLLFRCREREITDVKLLHLGTPSARNLNTIAERTEIPIRQVANRWECRAGGGVSVVPEILSKIVTFCNQKRWRDRRRQNPLRNCACAEK